jgi:beta-galactosidase
MDAYEAEITRTHDAVRAVDPTRPVMIDGGGATKENTLSVHGDHYVATLDLRYPDLAYEPFVEGGGRGRWTWDMQRPRFIGEDWYASGINPADYAMWGGEVAFQGKAATRDAIALIYRMLNEGYRWGGYYAAWQFWLGRDGGEAQWGANDPRAVFCRQWDWTFGSNQEVSRTFGLFNDTQHSEPLIFTRRLMLGGRTVFEKTTTHSVAPGTAEKFDEQMVMPEVNSRSEAELVLTLSAGGAKVFEDVKRITILPPVKAGDVEEGSVAVWDPKGETIHFLERVGVPFARIASIDSVPETVKLIVVGRDAISEAEATSPKLAALASKGHSVLVLDQAYPLRYQAIPAEMDLAPRFKKDSFDHDIPAAEGAVAFLEDASHPSLEGLENSDFFTWGPDHRVFHNAYIKPTRGAKSLVQCGPRLAFSALVEVPVGDGVMVLSQLDMGDKLATNPVAQHLLIQLIHAGLNYQLKQARVTTIIENEPLVAAMDAIGLNYSSVADPLAAISSPDNDIVMVSATPAHLSILAGNMPVLEDFWARGGTLIFCGLTPEGLADYNRIVGVQHHIRPFRRERVTFPPVRDPLTSGLTTGDVVMLSGERIFGWTADEYVASDVFSYVVDLDDIAPFAKSDFSSYGNIVNGFVGSDGWPLIIDFEFPRDGGPFEIRMDLPSEQTVAEYTHDMSLKYNPTTRIGLVFDGKDRVEFPLKATGDAETFAIDPPRRARSVTLQLLDWQPDPSKRPLVGIDNISLKVQRSPEWHATVRPMLNVGGLVHYVKGNGNIILCNILFKESETVPVNQTKKRSILASILRNLHAVFSGERTVIPGGNLECTPLDIHTKATTYKDERGWFGDQRYTFKGLPAGVHEFGGVPYLIYEMPTSPVPQVLMLGGRGVPGDLPEEITGIPVGRKADALFFLHTARIDRRMNQRDREQNRKFELCRYVIHYADGERVELPVYSEIDIENYVQEKPAALPGAQVVWTLPYDDDGARQAVLYAKQWNNPRPDVAVDCVDLLYGSDRDCGVPVLVGLTAALVGE